MCNHHLRNKELSLKAKGLLTQADRREENAQSAVSCIERGSERSGENQKERLQYLAARTTGTTALQKTGYGEITDKAADNHRRPILDFHLPVFFEEPIHSGSAVGADSLHFKKYTIPRNNQSVFVFYIKSITNAACIFYSHYLNGIFGNSQRFQTSALIDG